MRTFTSSWSSCPVWRPSPTPSTIATFCALLAQPASSTTFAPVSWPFPSRRSPTRASPPYFWSFWAVSTSATSPSTARPASHPTLSTAGCALRPWWQPSRQSWHATSQIPSEWPTFPFPTNPPFLSSSLCLALEWTFGLPKLPQVAFAILELPARWVFRQTLPQVALWGA